ncbi:MAG: VTT domain-containing protein [Pirellulales bacterium]
MELFRPLVPVVLILLVPILPFLVWGDALTAWIEHWRQSPPPPATTAAVGWSLLASDIFLPVPSSVVCTLLGWQLGGLAGTVVAWTGMTSGAMLGFLLARAGGPAFSRRFSRPRDLERIAQLRDRFGPTMLVVTRGIPVLSEASVLWSGLQGMTWRRFFPPVALANLALAVIYACFGSFAQAHGWLPWAITFSIALPVALAAGSRFWR